MDAYHQQIKAAYLQAEGDSTALFETVLAVAEEIGLDEALGYLAQSVAEKRLAWLNQNLERFERSDDPVYDGYRLFYELYLGVSAPEEGEIVERTEKRIVSRWWNSCPTLVVCQQLGLDTREICKKAYHQPVQVFLEQLDPRLRFERNYERLRPHTASCEEIIFLAE